MPKRRFVLAAAALVLVAGCGVGGGGGDSSSEAQARLHPDGMTALVLPKAFTVPSATLTDTRGASVDVRAALEKKLTLVFFGYTHCPDICQVVMANITAAVRRLPVEQRSDVGMLFITSDPSRDTASVLRRYLDRFDPSFEGLTGPLPSIVSVGHALGVAVDKGEKLPSGGYDVIHGTQVLGVLPSGSAPLVWNDNATSAQLASDMEKVLAHGVPSTDSGAS